MIQTGAQSSQTSRFDEEDDAMLGGMQGSNTQEKTARDIPHIFSWGFLRSRGPTPKGSGGERVAQWVAEEEGQCEQAHI